jgi:hypothetical protein
MGSYLIERRDFSRNGRVPLKVLIEDQRLNLLDLLLVGSPPFDASCQL